jgi:hypothetical protein
MTPATKRWIEASKILAVDPSASVPCPEREDGTLTVRDEIFESDSTRMERHLVCDTCGARNSLLMRVPTR